jgi:hypothetical protein
VKTPPITPTQLEGDESVPMRVLGLGEEGSKRPLERACSKLTTAQRTKGIEGQTLTE